MISRVQTPHQHCHQECSCGFMLRSGYSIDISLAHAHSAFSAEGSGDQTAVQSSLASFYGQWNMPCTVLTDLCFFHVGDMYS